LLGIHTSDSASVNPLSSVVTLQCFEKVILRPLVLFSHLCDGKMGFELSRRDASALASVRNTIESSPEVMGTSGLCHASESASMKRRASWTSFWDRGILFLTMRIRVFSCGFTVAPLLAWTLKRGFIEAELLVIGNGRKSSQHRFEALFLQVWNKIISNLPSYTSQSNCEESNLELNRWGFDAPPQFPVSPFILKLNWIFLD
jgi:hypothetical protein